MDHGLPDRVKELMSTITNSSAQQLDLARKAIIALWVLALLVALALAPSAFDATQANWQFNEVARKTSGVSYETLTAVIAGIRLALGALLLATAALLLSGSSQLGALIAALALTTLPFAFGLFGNADSTAFPEPWRGLLGAVTMVLAFVGGTAALALLFLFPDGRFYPARLRVLGLIGLALAAAGVVVMFRFENGWWIFSVALLVTVLLGVAGQALRYQDAGAAQRRRMAGFTAAVLLVPYWALVSMISAWPLLSLISGFIALAILAWGLYLGARRGLWGEPPSPRIFAGTFVPLVLVAAVAAGLWWRANQPQAIDVAGLASNEPVPVILDTDMAMDDIAALLFLLQHPAVDLRAITVNGVAFAHCEDGVRNALGLLEMAGAPEIPVSCGREEPFPGGTPAPDDWRRAADNLHGGQVRTGSRVPDSRPAAELLANTIRTAAGEIVVVAIGPLTNLAEAMQADPALAGQIKELIIMGGAVNAPGNVIDGDPTNQAAEWNFFGDPVAAGIVLASGAPITLVPLDATNDVPFTRGFYQRLSASHLTRPAVFTYNLIYMNQWWLDGGMYWWDTLAAALVIDPKLVTVEDMALDVITEEGPEMGRTVETLDGASMRVATAADRQAFEALFVAVLNHE